MTEEEARALLLSIDPLAALAQTQGQLYRRLRELTLTSAPELQTIWQACATAVPTPPDEPLGVMKVMPEQWPIRVTCRDERQQMELLGRVRGEGLECRALME